MAVVNTYVQSSYLNSQGSLITPDRSINQTGSGHVTLRALFQPGSGDSAGSVYRIWANVPATYIPQMICIASDAIAGLTSVALGLYLPRLGAVVNAGLFCTGVSLAAAITTLNPRYAIDGLAAIGLATSGMSLGALASNTPGYPSNYDIAMTVTTTSGNVGNIALWGLFANG